MTKRVTDSLNPLSEEVFGLESRELASDERFKKQKLSLGAVVSKIPPVFDSIG